LSLELSQAFLSRPDKTAAVQVMDALTLLTLNHHSTL